jgi:hypothetical protein
MGRTGTHWTTAPYVGITTFRCLGCRQRFPLAAHVRGSCCSHGCYDVWRDCEMAQYADDRLHRLRCDQLACGRRRRREKVRR